MLRIWAMKIRYKRFKLEYELENFDKGKRERSQRERERQRFEKSSRKSGRNESEKRQTRWENNRRKSKPQNKNDRKRRSEDDRTFSSTKLKNIENNTHISRKALVKLTHHSAIITADDRKYKVVQHARSAMRFELIYYNVRNVRWRRVRNVKLYYDQGNRVMRQELIEKLLHRRGSSSVFNYDYW